jgi:hypothetical protein
MSVILVADPPFPAKQCDEYLIAKVEHIWHSARRWAARHGYQYTSSYGVVGVAPT